MLICVVFILYSWSHSEDWSSLHCSWP